MKKVCTVDDKGLGRLLAGRRILFVRPVERQDAFRPYGLLLLLEDDAFVLLWNVFAPGLYGSWRDVNPERPYVASIYHYDSHFGGDRMQLCLAPIVNRLYAETYADVYLDLVLEVEVVDCPAPCGDEAGGVSAYFVSTPSIREAEWR
jgi:hypothetical protein